MLTSLNFQIPKYIVKQVHYYQCRVIIFSNPTRHIFFSPFFPFLLNLFKFRNKKETERKPPNLLSRYQQKCQRQKNSLNNPTKKKS